MTPARKLALRITWLTAVGAGLSAALLAYAVHLNAPVARTPELVQQFGHFRPLAPLVFSPDGQTLASGSHNSIALWNPARFALLRTLVSHQNLVWSLAFSPDGQTLASGSADKTVKLWNALTGALLRTLEGHQESVRSVAFSPDGQTLASASADAVKLWNADTGALLRTLHQDYALSVAFSPDGRTLAAGNPTEVKLWNVKSGAVIRTFERSGSFVGFSPNGRILATDDALWNPVTGIQLRILDISSVVESGAFSPNGQVLALATSNNTVELWNPASGERLGALVGCECSVMSVAFSPDGQTLASASHEAGGRVKPTSPLAPRRLFPTQPDSVKLWGRSPAALLRTLDHDESVSSVAFSPDGKILAAAGSRKKFSLFSSFLTDFSKGWDSDVRLLNTATGELLGTLGTKEFSPITEERNWEPPRSALLTLVAFSSDGGILAAASTDGKIELWKKWHWTGPSDSHQDDKYKFLPSPEDGKLIGHQGDVRSLAFSPDGQTLASGSADKTISSGSRALCSIAGWGCGLPL